MFWHFGSILCVDVSKKQLLGEVEIWEVKGHDFIEEVWIQKMRMKPLLRFLCGPLSLLQSRILCDLGNHKNSSYCSCVKILNMAMNLNSDSSQGSF